jgi:low temperature requirement protein LtrA
VRLNTMNSHTDVLARRRAGRDGGPERVSNLDLFFDLVFVFTITQVADVVVHHPDLSGIGHAAIELSILAWMFGGA